MTYFLAKSFRTANAILALAALLAVPGAAEAQSRSSYLPNPKLTPGATIDATKSDLCGPGHADFANTIPIALKRKVFDRYGIGGNTPGAFDVDRLIPLGLGGSNSIKNLWPQPMSGEWNHDMKNKLEQRLHKMVCDGKLDLKAAQQEIATDWIRAYRKYIGESGKPRSRN